MRRLTFIFLTLLSLSLSGREMPRFKVGTYNLFTSDSRLKFVGRDSTISTQRLWCNSAVAVADMIVHLDCDIMGVQEVCDSIWNGPQNIRKLVADRGLEYEWILYPNTTHGHISYDDAIGYKPSVFECLESGIFWLAGVFERPEMAEDAPQGSMRPCVWGHMRHKASGREFYFLSTHLLVPRKLPDGSWSQEGNKYNAKMIRRWTDENIPDNIPSILVGDMNVDDKAKHWLSLAQSRFMDTKLYMLRAKRISADAKTWGTQNIKDESGYSKWWPDHIMFNMFRPLDYVIDRSKFPTADGTLHYPSDHLPVTSVMEFRDYSESGLPTPAKKKKAVRVVSFNVRYRNNNVDWENGWDHRKFAIPAMIKDVLPDVMGTQEIQLEQIQYLDREVPQYKHLGIFREGEEKGECASVYYNDETVKLVDWGGFWLSETPERSSLGWDAKVKRTAVWAHFKMKDTGKEFLFVNTHLDHKGVEARQKGMDLILDTLAVINKAKLPVVIAGDLNSQLSDKALTRLCSEMNDARSTAQSSDDKYAFNGFGYSWTGNIDHIFYKGFRKCTDFKVVSRKYLHINYISDHYPIRADFEL